jgi:hypothetical protein
LLEFVLGNRFDINIGSEIDGRRIESFVDLLIILVILLLSVLASACCGLLDLFTIAFIFAIKVEQPLVGVFWSVFGGEHLNGPCLFLNFRNSKHVDPVGDSLLGIVDHQYVELL